MSSGPEDSAFAPSGDSAAHFTHPAPFTPEPTQSSRFKRLVPLVAIPVVLVVAGGAFAAYKVGVFGAPGVQPSSLAPANSVAFMAVDLNPSAKAKLGAYEFSQAFESGKEFSKATFKDDLLAKVFAESDLDTIDYATEVAPWVGDRMAMAAVPAPDTEDGVTGLAIIEYTDEEAAEAALTKWQATEDDDETVHWAFKNNFVLIGIDKDTVSAAAAAETSLEDNATYTHDKATIGDDTIAHAWVDTAALVDIAPEDVTSEVPAETLARLDGSLIVGTTLNGEYMEVTGHGFGYDSPGTTGPVAHLVALPADATVAFEVTGLGDSLGTAWTEYAPKDEWDIAASAAEMGVVLPDDLLAVFGTDFAAAASGFDADPKVNVVVSTEDSERAVELLTGDLVAEAGVPLQVAPTGDGYIVSYGAVGDTGSLGEHPQFVEAVPNADGAHAFAFVNVADLVAMERAQQDSMGGDEFTTDDPTTPVDPSEEDELKDAEALEAAGISATVDGDRSSFTFRLTLKD